MMKSRAEDRERFRRYQAKQTWKANLQGEKLFFLQKVQHLILNSTDPGNIPVRFTKNAFLGAGFLPGELSKFVDVVLDDLSDYHIYYGPNTTEDGEIVFYVARGRKLFPKRPRKPIA